MADTDSKQKEEFKDEGMQADEEEGNDEVRVMPLIRRVYADFACRRKSLP